jgi:ornithine cyclodeaminase/alanine dehydrogenase-like protein (mu-crystallin family)
LSAAVRPAALERFRKRAPRVASYSRDGVIELMPTSDGEFYGFKYVNGHPKNTRIGLQTVTGFGVLSDVETGYPRLLSEMTITTALRTAATSAVAAKYLAGKDAQVMAIIGLGSQSEFQALAFKAVNGIRRLRVFDIDRAATGKLLSNLAPYFSRLLRGDRSPHRAGKLPQPVTRSRSRAGSWRPAEHAEAFRPGAVSNDPSVVMAGHSPSEGRRRFR